MEEKQIDLEELFLYINRNKRGTISNEDLELLFEIYGFEATEEDIEILIGFFDRNGT